MSAKSAGNDFQADVIDTIKDPTGLIIHKGKVVSGTVRVGENVTLSVDPEKRRATALNHTATHLLHAALRQYPGRSCAPGRFSCVTGSPAV